jgi:hypothetical protein
MIDALQQAQQYQTTPSECRCLSRMLSGLVGIVANDRTNMK